MAPASAGGSQSSLSSAQSEFHCYHHLLTAAIPLYKSFMGPLILAYYWYISQLNTKGSFTSRSNTNTKFSAEFDKISLDDAKPS